MEPGTGATPLAIPYPGTLLVEYELPIPVGAGYVLLGSNLVPGLYDVAPGL